MDTSAAPVSVRDEAILAALARGDTAAMIAAAHGFVSRSAALGHIRRLRLRLGLDTAPTRRDGRAARPAIRRGLARAAKRVSASRGGPQRPSPAPAAGKRAAAPPPVAAAPAAPVPVVPLWITLFELKPVGSHGAQCRFPRGDRAPYLFCGLPALEGASWCAHHATTVFAPTPRPPAVRDPMVAPARARAEAVIDLTGQVVG